MWYDFTKRNVGDSGNSNFLTVKKAEKRKFTNFHFNKTEIYFTFERFIVQNSWNKAYYSAMNGAIRWFLCRCRTLVLNLVLFVERFIILDPDRPYTVDYFQMRKTVFSWERVLRESSVTERQVWNSAGTKFVRLREVSALERVRLERVDCICRLARSSNIVLIYCSNKFRRERWPGQNLAGGFLFKPE